MGKAYILEKRRFTPTEVYTDIVGIYTNKTTVYADAQKIALNEIKEFSPETGDEFIWTAYTTFGSRELFLDGVLYMTLGSKKTDSIVEYSILKVKEGEFKK